MIMCPDKKHKDPSSMNNLAPTYKN